MTKSQRRIYDWLISKPGYFKKSIEEVSRIFYENQKSKPFGYTIHDFNDAFEQAKINYKLGIIINSKQTKNTFKIKKSSKDESFLNKDNVIFIADLHAPHILKGYLKWCKELQNRYDCGTVIFSGDIVDGGAWNYHEKNPDSPGVKDELYAAKKQLKDVYKMFPEAVCLLGNHDLLISRKAKTIGLSQHFIRNLHDILEAPKEWKFVHQYKKDNVIYKHGAYGDAFKAATESRISTCQGHFHAKSFVQWSVSEKDAIFGLQVGAGFDRDQMAFDYAKPFHKKPIISCGLILDKGLTPIVKIMPL